MGWLDKIAKVTPIVGDLLDFGMGIKAQNQAKHQFDQQMDHSVRRRVDDARRAGVHPLFALGASVGASPTIQAGSTTGLGQAGRSIAALSQNKRLFRLQELESQARVRESNARAAESEAAARALENSVDARITQAANHSGRDTEAKEVLEPQHSQRGLGPVEIVRPEIPAHQPGKIGTQAGQAPAFRELVRDDGRVYRIWTSDANADEINQAWLLLQAGQYAFGDFLDRVTNLGGRVERVGRTQNSRRRSRSAGPRSRRPNPIPTRSHSGGR